MTIRINITEPLEPTVEVDGKMYRANYRADAQEWGKWVEVAR